MSDLSSVSWRGEGYCFFRIRRMFVLVLPGKQLYHPYCIPVF
jgi:hypothetical protein